MKWLLFILIPVGLYAGQVNYRTINGNEIAVNGSPEFQNLVFNALFNLDVILGDMSQFMIRQGIVSITETNDDKVYAEIIEKKYIYITWPDRFRWRGYGRQGVIADLAYQIIYETTHTIFKNYSNETETRAITEKISEFTIEPELMIDYFP